jgi:hypothetical protein
MPSNIDQNNVELTSPNINLKVKGNTFKFENKPSFIGGSGSIVRSSIAASRHKIVKESRRPGFKSRPEHCKLLVDFGLILSKNAQFEQFVNEAKIGARIYW